MNEKNITQNNQEDKQKYIDDKKIRIWSDILKKNKKIKIFQQSNKLFIVTFNFSCRETQSYNIQVKVNCDFSSFFYSLKKITSSGSSNDPEYSTSVEFFVMVKHYTSKT